MGSAEWLFKELYSADKRVGTKIDPLVRAQNRGQKRRGERNIDRDRKRFKYRRGVEEVSAEASSSGGKAAKQGEVDSMTQKGRNEGKAQQDGKSAQEMRQQRSEEGEVQREVLHLQWGRAQSLRMAKEASN